MHGLSSILFDLFFLFVAAKFAGALFARLGQPAVVGELLAGVLIGPYALALIGTPDASLIELFGGDEEAAQGSLDLVYDLLAEMGVILLLFFVGLEMRLADLLGVGRRAVIVGTLGIVCPFIGGYLLMAVYGRSSVETFFVAAALVSTSSGITARVLRDLGVLGSSVSRIILGAAIVDDILAMIILGLVVGLSETGDINVLNLALIAAQAVAFVAFASFVGTRAIRRYHYHIDRLPLEHAALTVSLAVMLGLAAVATSIGLAAIIGAFLAGIILAEAREHYELERSISPIYQFFVPFFFVITGTKVDPGIFLDADIVGIAAVVTVVAIITKLVGAAIGAIGLGPRSAAIIGTGMVPRGEVGLIVASLGLSRGVIDTELFSVVVVMSIVTTLIVPPILARLFSKTPREEAPVGDESMASSGRIPAM